MAEVEAVRKMKQQMGFLGKAHKRIDASRSIRHSFSDVLPGEAAVTLTAALQALGLEWEEESTWSAGMMGMPTETPFARYMVSLDGREVCIPWGTYKVDGLGKLQLMIDNNSHMPKPAMIFYPEKDVDTKKSAETMDLIIKYINENGPKSTLFRGRALKVSAPEDLLIPQPINTSSDIPVILNRDVEEMLDVGIYLPIRNRLAFKQRGIRMRRGAILVGPYGVGKSLTAYKAAREATENGWTFIMSPSSIAGIAVGVSRALEPCVLFLEDIDSRTGGDRDSLNNLLNIMSSVDSKKKMDTITIMSTNFVKRIDPAFLRPERIDSIVEMSTPNAETAGRLIISILGDGINETAGWGELCKEAGEGWTHALIGEAVQRALILSEGTGQTVTAELVHRMLKQLHLHREMSEPKLVEEDYKDRLADGIHRAVYSGAYDND